MVSLPLLLCIALPLAQDPASAETERIAAAARRIVAHEMQDGRAFEMLRTLCDDIGHRLSGSPQAERAVEWAAETLRGFDVDVRLHAIEVPKWVRGAREEVTIVAPARHELVALALGGSIATPPEGITAPVLVVKTFDELRERAEEAKGRIVLFNRAMGPEGEAVLGYGDVVPQRTRGAIEAAKAGAVGSLIRSVGTADYRLPHTGMMRYEEGVPKIPHAAVTAEDADLLARLVERHGEVTVTMKLHCRDEGLAPSANVIAELKGRERPDEVVVLGAHLDSWDVGQGAQDDGSGVVACMEALRLLKLLDLTPRRTVRVVLFMNEENGLAGGLAYARDFADELPKHVAAIEMDGGSFRFNGFGVSAGEGGVERLAGLKPLLAALGSDSIRAGGGGADIGPMRGAGVPQIGLSSDGTRYFDYHHTPADTLDKVDPVELARCSAGMAIIAYALAEMDEPLPRIEGSGTGTR